MNLDKKHAAFLSIISNSFLIIFKIIAGVLMGSVSVISEAIHSSIDLAASLIAFLSIKKASKAEDYEHPYGHGKYENVSGFVEAILILIAAIIIMYESVSKLIKGVEIENVGAGILVMFTASLVNFIISRLLFISAKNTNSIALEADAYHLLTDVYTAGGVFLGLVLIKFTGIKIIDPITAIMVSLLILRTSIKLIKKSMVDLVDTKLPDDDIKVIVNVIDSYPQILNFHKLKTRKSGEKREVEMHLVITESASLVDAHNLCDKVEGDIKRNLPNTDVIIHIEPFDKKLA